MVAFLVSEAALFSTLIVVYLTFLGRDDRRPLAPGGPLAPARDRHDDLPAVEQRDDPSGREGTAGGGRPRRVPEVVVGHDRPGLVFLMGTGYEWFDLITRHGLTIGPGTSSGAPSTPWSASTACTCRPAWSRCSIGPAPGRARPSGRRAGGVVLAFRGRRLGGRLLGGVSLRPVIGSPTDEVEHEWRAIRTRSSQNEPTGSVEVPRPTVAPMVLALGMAMLAAGVATSVAFLIVGAAMLVFGLGLWVSQLIPGRGESSTRRWSSPRDAASPGDGQGRRRGADAGRNARLEAPAADRGASDLRGDQGGGARRVADAGSRPGLGPLERARDLVPSEPARGIRPARRGTDDDRRTGAVPAAAPGSSAWRSTS